MERDDQEARLRGLQEEYSNQKSLLEHVGWQELMLTAADQLQGRLPSALSKTENLLEILPKEFEKGEIAGIELFCGFPGIRMAALEDDINKLEEELGYDDRKRASDGSDGEDRDSDSGTGDFTGDAP